MKVIRHIVFDSTRAATLVLDVNEETKTAFLYLSVCNGDVFSRKRGVELAEGRDPVLFFKLKSLDNFKDRALAAVLYECIGYPRESVLGQYGATYHQWWLLLTFLKHLGNERTSF